MKFYLNNRITDLKNKEKKVVEKLMRGEEATTLPTLTFARIELEKTLTFLEAIADTGLESNIKRGGLVCREHTRSIALEISRGDCIICGENIEAKNNS